MRIYTNSGEAATKSNLSDAERRAHTEKDAQRRVSTHSRAGVNRAGLPGLLLLIAFLLANTAGAYAQLNWTGTQTLTAGQTITSNINLTGNVTINVASGTATISGVISGSSTFTVTKTGAGQLNLTGNNTYTGTTTISAGTLSIGNNTTTGAIAGNIVNNGILIFNR